MTAMVNAENSKTIFQEIEEHSAWIGAVSGLSAEKMLRGKQIPYLYLLRAGEQSKKANEKNYYVTFLDSELSVRHQPLVVTEQMDRRLFENGGIYMGASIEDVIHLVLHCEKDQSAPLQQQA